MTTGIEPYLIQQAWTAFVLGLHCHSPAAPFLSQLILGCTLLWTAPLPIFHELHWDLPNPPLFFFPSYDTHPSRWGPQCPFFMGWGLFVLQYFGFSCSNFSSKVSKLHQIVCLLQFLAIASLSSVYLDSCMLLMWSNNTFWWKLAGTVPWITASAVRISH